MTTYDASTALDETVEVRITVGTGTLEKMFVLTAWKAQNGTVGYSLSLGSGGVSEALSNLQSRQVFPRKAVPGWQREVIEFAKAGLGTVKEIR
jgi:hypothetical protein